MNVDSGNVSRNMGFESSNRDKGNLDSKLDTEKHNGAPETKVMLRGKPNITNHSNNLLLKKISKN